MIFKELIGFFQKVIQEIIIVCVTFIFVFIIVPILLILILLMYFYREFVRKLAILFKPDLAKILTTRGVIYAVDDVYKSPNCNLLGVVQMEGNLDLETARATVLERIGSKNPKTGHLNHPELKQSIVRWMGFTFWKPDPNFDIRNHIIYHEPKIPNEIFDDDKFLELEKQLLKRPNKEGQSPWEVIIAKDFISKKDPNPIIPKSILFLKIHHSICDGYSLAKLVTYVADFQAKCTNMPNFEPEKRPFWLGLLIGIGFMIRAPYDIVKTLLTVKDVNSYHLPEDKMSKLPYVSVTDRISMDIFKEIKNCYDVTVTSVILAAIAGGVRAHFIRSKTKVPESIHCGTALPWPGHPNKLRNHMTCCLVKLPIGTPCPVKRLKMINKNLKDLRRSTVPSLIFMLWKIVGGMTNNLARVLGKNKTTTAILSNFPGPPVPIDFVSYPIYDMHFASGMLGGNTAIIIAAVSYNNAIKIAIHVDESVIPNAASCDDMRDLVCSELDILRDAERV